MSSGSRDPARPAARQAMSIGGAVLGAIIGGAAGGGGGAAIGAVAGGTVGTAASAASPGPHAWIPAEALVTFHLNTPVTVQPVSQQEAARLAQGLYPGGPTLYRRPAVLWPSLWTGWCTPIRAGVLPALLHGGRLLLLALIPPGIRFYCTGIPNSGCPNCFEEPGARVDLEAWSCGGLGNLLARTG